MKILLKTICYILASLLFFGICSGLFPEKEYGGASPSENHQQNSMIGFILLVLLHSSVFVFLFYKEFLLPKIWSVLLCFCLHFLLVSVGFYLIVMIFYDFLILHYPDLSNLISERDVYNDDFPSTFFILSALGSFMIFAVWGSVSGLKKLINNSDKS